MIICGVDPGSRFMGYGIIKKKKNKFEYITSGVLDFSKESEFLERPALIFQKSEEVFKKYRPDILAIEKLIHVKNVNSLAKLSQARGAVLAAAWDISKKFEYSPNLIKQVVCQFGHADKSSVMKAVELFLGARDFKSHDESDALAIALCCALSRQRPELKGASRGSMRDVFGAS